MLILLPLTGCSTRYIENQIDPRLTADCDMPELMGSTWRDIAIVAVEREAAIVECNSRLKVIRGD